MSAFRGLACIWALVLIMTCPDVASAFRAPSGPEFDAIAAAVEKNPDGSYYCAERRTTWISTLRRRWALAQMRSNCGLGSQTVRFFLKRRADRPKGWRLVERQYELPGTGRGVPCGSRRTPPDIRCGPLIVHDRMRVPWGLGDTRPATTHACRDVVIRTETGAVYTRTEELVAWQIGCRRARKVARAYLHGSEGVVTPPRPFGFHCRTARLGGRCQKGGATLWWSWDLDAASCRYFDAPYPCPGERPCGRVPTISEGVQIRGSVFTRGYACERARSIVASGHIPPGWAGAGSGAGGIYVEGTSSISGVPMDQPLHRAHVRHSNIVF